MTATAAETRKAHREDIATIIPANKRDALGIMAKALTAHLTGVTLEQILSESLHSLTQAERSRLEWARDEFLRRINGTKAAAAAQNGADEPDE